MPKASRQPHSPATSLLHLPSDWRRLSLAELKRLARSANFESAWDAIGKDHRQDLVEALEARAAEWTEFVASVTSYEATVEKAKGVLRKSKKLGAALETALDAAVHMIPSGSGASLGNGLVLTCAHCVDHDDDDNDDQDPEPLGIM